MSYAINFSQSFFKDGKRDSLAMQWHRKALKLQNVHHIASTNRICAYESANHVYVGRNCGKFQIMFIWFDASIQYVNKKVDIRQ